MIAAWWAGLSLIMKVLWGLTLTASLVFVIQTVATFLGADAGGDFDTDLGGADFDASAEIPDDASAIGHSGQSLYTFRNLINFILGFGWTAIILQPQVKSTVLLVLVSVLVGIGLVAIVMLLFKWLSSMQASGNIDVRKSAAGCQGKVYLTIPGERAGAGKVQITIDNSVREYDAVTDSGTLATGTSIKVLEVIDNHTLVVEELNSLII